MTDALPYRRKEIIGDCTLYLGDCRDILPTLGKVDAVVTDPPYGLGDKWQGHVEGEGKWPLFDEAAMHWDATIPDNITQLVALADHSIVWGGNYFDLPPRRGWLLWDKIVRQFSSGHAEMAWTTLDQPVRTFNYAHGQLASEGKQHPTQKPLPLMKWCLGFLPDAKTILDPFMGSGTTGVACVKLGKSFIGIEREPDYFDIACERIRKAYAQPDLVLAPPAPQAKQEAFDGL